MSGFLNFIDIIIYIEYRSLQNTLHKINTVL